MKSQGYMLRSELEKGLKKYGKDNNLSPLSIIEDLVEDFLCREDYLCAEWEVEPKQVKKIKYTQFDKRSNAYQITKQKDGCRWGYGSTNSCTIANEIVNFLKSVDWDPKYSTSCTKLKGVDQINFLLKEMEQNK